MVRIRRANQTRTRARVRRAHHQRADGRRAVSVQRERAEHEPHHEPTTERVRRSAGVGQSERIRAGARWRAAAAMRRADKLKSLYSVVIGGNEAVSGRASFKRMADGLQTDVALTVTDIHALVRKSEQ